MNEFGLVDEFARYVRSSGGSNYIEEWSGDSFKSLVTASYTLVPINFCFVDYHKRKNIARVIFVVISTDIIEFVTPPPPMGVNGAAPPQPYSPMPAGTPMSEQAKRLYNTLDLLMADQWLIYIIPANVAPKMNNFLNYMIQFEAFITLQHSVSNVVFGGILFYCTSLPQMRELTVAQTLCSLGVCTPLLPITVLTWDKMGESLRYFPTVCAGTTIVPMQNAPSPVVVKQEICDNLLPIGSGKQYRNELYLNGSTDNNIELRSAVSSVIGNLNGEPIVSVCNPSNIQNTLGFRLGWLSLSQEVHSMVADSTRPVMSFTISHTQGFNTPQTYYILVLTHTHLLIYWLNSDCQPMMETLSAPILPLPANRQHNMELWCMAFNGETTFIVTSQNVTIGHISCTGITVNNSKISWIVFQPGSMGKIYDWVVGANASFPTFVLPTSIHTTQGEGGDEKMSEEGLMTMESLAVVATTMRPVEPKDRQQRDRLFPGLGLDHTVLSRLLQAGSFAITVTINLTVAKPQSGVLEIQLTEGVNYNIDQGPNNSAIFQLVVKADNDFNIFIKVMHVSSEAYTTCPVNLGPLLGQLNVRLSFSLISYNKEARAVAVYAQQISTSNKVSAPILLANMKLPPQSQWPLPCSPQATPVVFTTFQGRIATTTFSTPKIGKLACVGLAGRGSPNVWLTKHAFYSSVSNKTGHTPVLPAILWNQAFRRK